MLLSLLLSVRVGKYCQAPHFTSFPDPVPNSTLVYAQVAFRHGHRSPLYTYLNVSERGEWNCNSPEFPGARTSTAPSRRYRFYHHRLDPRYVDYPPSCRMGDLTEIGQNQHIHLGSTYRQYLVDKLHFLPEKLDPSFIELVSSPVDRCYRSCESFVDGLYPPQNPNEVLSIETGTDDISDLVVSGGYCKELSDAMDAFREGPEVTTFITENLEYLQPGLTALGENVTWRGIKNLCGWMIAFNCSDSPRPTWMTDTLVATCSRESQLDQYGQFSRKSVPRGLYGSYSLRKMLNAADERLADSKSGKKFAVYSAHDTTIAAINVALGHVENEMPPYTSHLMAEYWKNHDDGEIYIRWVYNTEPLKLDLFGGKEVVRLDNFRFEMTPLLQHCLERDEMNYY